MTRPINYDPRAVAKRELAAMRSLAQPKRSLWVRLWAWLNQPLF
jgi:hypothetical protein